MEPFTTIKDHPLTRNNEPASQQQIGLLKHCPFPELAAALRSQTAEIIGMWVEEVRHTLPTVHSLSFEEVEDSVPVILARMADALESTDGDAAARLAAQSPAQGITRFHQRYDINELVLEDRLLRRVIIERTQSAMDRRMSLEEQIALDMAVDVMLQQAVVAFVDEQRAKLRDATEVELKYLSFLSHDLNNNLNGVTLTLQVLKRRLEIHPEFASELEAIDDAQHGILATIGGMGRLLENERLRKGGIQAKRQPIGLRSLLTTVVRQSSKAAEIKGLMLVVTASPEDVAQSDGELIALVIQNLVGNAIKFSSRGTIRIDAKCDQGPCTISVSDEGPGIPPDQLERIFESFARGDTHMQSGVGLGLAIASHAAKGLDAKLTVESTVDVGSIFRLTLPALMGG